MIRCVRWAAILVLASPVAAVPAEDRWPEEDADAFLATCQTVLPPAACGCILADLEAYYGDYDDFIEDGSDAAARAAFNRCWGLVPREDR